MPTPPFKPRIEPKTLRSVGILLSCLLVAAVANVVVISLRRATDQRRMDQVHAATLHLDFHHLLSLLQAGTRGEDVRSYKGLIDHVETSAGQLRSPALRDDIDRFWAAYGGFRVKADAQVAAIQTGDLPRARRMDARATNPEYAKVQRTIEDLERRCREQARLWIVLSDVATAVCLLTAAIVVAALFARHQRKTLELVASAAQQESAESAQRRFRSLIRHSGDVIAVLSADGRFRLVSEASERQWKVESTSLLGEQIFRLVHPDDVLRLRRALDEVAAKEQASIEIEIMMESGPDEYRSFHVHLVNLLTFADVLGILGTFHDITERKRLEAELVHHAFHDRLTGLPNRALFLNRLAHRLRSVESSVGECAVLFIDLDNFKIVNDSLGHIAGDQLLVTVAERMRTVVRPGDTVARLGGDEFTVVLDGVHSAADAVATAARILDTFKEPVVIEDREVIVTCSIGIAMNGSTRYADAHGLLRDADTAMYEAKARGKCGYALFDPRMNDAMTERLELEYDLRTALEHDQLLLHYQPIVDVLSGRLEAVEALIRWQHPDRGTIAPSKFIPIAEETGLICSIGHWVLRQSCAQLAEWVRLSGGTARLGLCVNVSGKQFQQADFVDQVRGILEEFGVDPTLVKLEVTETAMLKDIETMRRVFEELRGLGVRIAIDDFGTGYSSISYLSRLPVDTLKIDQSFINLLGGDGRTDGIVRAMIAMARHLTLHVTSEGIETPEQLATLRRLGCDSAQGFLFARPLEADQIELLLADHASLPLTNAPVA
jgi:diguanylate cyclase (GGDEF)-like protein/PAS domain S-box-containing protein